MVCILVTGNDILDCIKGQGFETSYNFAKKYIDFLEKRNASSSDLCKRLEISRGCLYHWLKGERVPKAVQMINNFEDKGVLPLVESETLARIIGYIHGDGWVTNDLRAFGFCSSDITMINQFCDDVNKVFNIKGSPEMKCRRGENVTILGKKRTARKDIYRLMYSNSGISKMLYLSGRVKGKKVFNEFSAPGWIVNGKIEYKRAFLNGLFDSEMSNFQIHSYHRHENNIGAIRMEMCKCEDLIKNLDEYLQSIKEMLTDFGVEAHISKPIFVRTDKSGKAIYKETLFIRNFRSFYNFITKIGFLSSQYKKNKSKEVLKLIGEKIRSRNKMYMVMTYISKINSFTTRDLERDLGISRGYTKIIAKTLFETGYANRNMEKLEGKGYIWWYDYIVDKEKVKAALNSDLSIMDIKPIRN